MVSGLQCQARNLCSRSVSRERVTRLERALAPNPITAEPGGRTLRPNQRYTLRVTGLERILERELNQAWIPDRCVDYSEEIGVVTGERRICKHSVIGDIEELGAKLQVLPLRQLRVLDDGHIVVDLTGAANYTQSRVAERSCSVRSDRDGVNER